MSMAQQHFLPFFGKKPMHQITPSLVQDWVTKAAAGGLSPRSIRKYHTMLHSIFKRAVRDQLITTNPCEHTELPKAITKKARTLTPTEYELLIAAIPARYRLLVETAIETGMRWGELIALRPRHIAFLTRAVPVEETILEVSRRYSPTGQNYVTRPTPRTTNPETSASTNTGSTPSPTASELTSRCSPPPPAPPSHATLPHPHLATRRQDQRHRLPVRMHDLPHAHASWLLAEGSDLKSVMERMGHAQIQTTQKYLHALPEADRKNLDALAGARQRPQQPI